MGVPFLDLVDRHAFDDFDPEKGSSPHWLDNMHFKPVVGRWILDQVGPCGWRPRSGPSAFGNIPAPD